MANQSRYSKRIVKRICDLIASDTYTIAEICSIVGISERCYYGWQSKNADFAESIIKAREKYDEKLVSEAKKSLTRLVTGFDVEEKKTVYISKNGQPRIKEQIVTKKHYAPNTAAVIFQLCNKTPEEYSQRLNTELTGKGGKDLFASLSDDDLNKKIRELEKKLSKGSIDGNL